MNNIGILLGSFDPIHIGHIALATHALNTKIVDKVILVPAYHNPWKKDQPEPFKDRMQMCCLALNGLSSISVSSVEEYYAELYGLDKVNSYEIINRLKEQYSSDNLILIMTNETFSELPLWQNGLEIVQENRFLILPRNETVTDWRLLARTKENWVIRSLPKIEISSTYIRNMCAEGQEIVPWVPKEVAKYITSKNLYK